MSDCIVYFTHSCVLMPCNRQILRLFKTVIVLKMLRNLGVSILKLGLLLRIFVEWLIKKFLQEMSIIKVGLIRCLLRGIACKLEFVLWVFYFFLLDYLNICLEKLLGLRVLLDAVYVVFALLTRTLVTALVFCLNLIFDDGLGLNVSLELLIHLL